MARGWKLDLGSRSCADPEGGTGGPDPPWNLKILPKEGNFRIFRGLDPPSSVTKNYHFHWTPSHESFWIRACRLVMYCPCRENKGTDQLCGYCEANLC